MRYESPYTDEKGEPILRIWRIGPGKYLRLAYCDGTQFWVDTAGTTLWATWPDSSSLENAASYLLGPVFGILLRLRGTICLHASAVSIQDRSIAFIGPPGAGKSTTAAAFVRLGHAAISDDIVALVEAGDEFSALPAYPHIALCPDAADLLFGSSEALPLISPDWEKRRLALGSAGTRFEERTLPLAAIYELGDRRASPAPFVETVPEPQALMALVVNSFATNFLDREMRAHEFKVLGRLISRVPVRRVIPHQDPARIDELCRVIREDFETLRGR
ncbi:MAG: HPr kinase/phosphatase C-terminal domain-containing protein [Candidatus Acidiferrum sp.]